MQVRPRHGGAGWLLDESRPHQMPGGAGIVERVEPMVLFPTPLPFHHHSSAGHEFFGLDLGRQMLGQRQVVGQRGLE